MLILLPPSEGKTAPSRGKPLDLERLSFPSLQAPRAVVLDALVDLCTPHRADAVEQATKALGLGKTQSDQVERNAALRDAPTARADRVYSGVLYEALDIASLEGAARRRATTWLAVVSGLFGLVRPADPIPAYRLSGDVALPGVGNVASFWKQHLDAAVRDAAGKGLVIDLRSSTYAAFWRPDPELARRTVTMRVLHEVNGARKVVSHFNKATKGRVVRDLVQDGRSLRRPAELAQHLKGLGWAVEVGEPDRHGTRIDIVVTEL